MTFGERVRLLVARAKRSRRAPAALIQAMRRRSQKEIRYAKAEFRLDDAERRGYVKGDDEWNRAAQTVKHDATLLSCAIEDEAEEIMRLFTRHGEENG